MVVESEWRAEAAAGGHKWRRRMREGLLCHSPIGNKEADGVHVHVCKKLFPSPFPFFQGISHLNTEHCLLFEIHWTECPIPIAGLRSAQCNFSLLLSSTAVC